MTVMKDHGLATIILAAGKGTRMKSRKAKVLHTVGGKPMIDYPVALSRQLGAERTVVVVGHQAAAVRNAVSDTEIVFAEQTEQWGTAHAVLQTEAALGDFSGVVLILCGDVPLLTAATVGQLITVHRTTAAVITIMTARLDDPSGYGRIVTDHDGQVIKIVEDSDATPEEKQISEINTGIYCVNNPFLFSAIHAIENRNVQGEYYLTDIVEIAVRRSLTVSSFVIEDPVEAMGINTVADLRHANAVLKSRHPTL